jgi:hypothetical protein
MIISIGDKKKLFSAKPLSNRDDDAHNCKADTTKTVTPQKMADFRNRHDEFEVNQVRVNVVARNDISDSTWPA